MLRLATSSYNSLTFKHFADTKLVIYVCHSKKKQQSINSSIPHKDFPMSQNVMLPQTVKNTPLLSVK